MPNQLEGLRVLLIEDESLVAELIVDILETAGCAVIGPFARIDPALRAAAEETFDAALLDLDLAGVSTFPVAAFLASRNLPFIFLTGFGKGALQGEYAGHPIIAKPFKSQNLLDMLTRVAKQKASS
jgi:DNA-binding response OmpR family regulator